MTTMKPASASGKPQGQKKSSSSQPAGATPGGALGLRPDKSFQDLILTL